MLNDSFVTDAEGGGSTDADKRWAGVVNDRRANGREPKPGVGEIGESKLIDEPSS